MGGTDDEENLTPPISIELHAAFHKDLYKEFGHKYDYIAWKALDGRITSEEARLMAAKIGQDNSEKYKSSRTAKYFQHKKEDSSAGGKIASVSLVEWQNKNRTSFLAQCSINGKLNSAKQKIPHTYMNTTFDSKRALQTEHNLCNNAFYRKLASGDIQREIEKRRDA